MDPISTSIAAVSIVIAVVSFFNAGKKDAVNKAESNATSIATLTQENNNQTKILDTHTKQCSSIVTDVATLKATVDILQKTQTKLESDLKTAVEQINNKVDKILLHMSKGNNNV